jgi:hypothetical protein
LEICLKVRQRSLPGVENAVSVSSPGYDTERSCCTRDIPTTTALLFCPIK